MTDVPEPKPEIPAAVESLVKERLAEFRTAISDEDFATAATAARACWDAIPDPKSQWNYYPDILPRTIADQFVRAGDVQHAREWLTIAMDDAPTTIGENVSLDRVAARVHAALGNRETAELIAGTLLELYGTRPFSGDDSDLLPLARAHRSPAEALDADDGNGHPIPSAEEGAATERPDLDDEIERLSEAGSQAMDDEDWRAAVRHWTRALEIIPTPRNEWSAATWLYTVLGDAYYTGGRAEQAVDALAEALKCPDASGSPFLWLRLGQALVDTETDPDAIDTAVKALLSAYMLAGEDIFADQDPRYLTLLAERVDLTEVADSGRSTD